MTLPTDACRDAFMALCREIAKKHAAGIVRQDEVRPDIGHRISRLAIGEINVGLELRVYLWCLFLHLEQHLVVKPVDLSSSSARNFGWLPVLSNLTTNYCLTVVTFNYDFFVQELVMQLQTNLLNVKPKMPRTKCVDCWMARNPSEVVILTPHGTLRHWVMPPLPSNWWLVTDQVNMTFSGNQGHIQDWPGGQPPFGCKFVPDIVPPGHRESHRYDCESDVETAIKLAVADADCVVICGLSGEAPDDQEIDGYLLRMKSNTVSIQIGLPGDEENDTGQMLKKYCPKNYRFANARTGEEQFIPAWLKKMVVKRSRPSKKIAALREMGMGVYTEEEILKRFDD